MNYKEIIESRYNRQNWQLLLRDIFGSKIKFWSTPSIVATSSAFAKQALWLGTITLSDEQTIAVYEVELADNIDIERNRRGIRDMLLTTWRNNGNAGAFMFCYRKSESVLRFSYVSEAWKFAEDGSYQKETTDARRFTYLLGEGHRSRTAIQQFEKLRGSGLSLKDLTKAFSVDAVSDMFFDGYKKQYEDIIFYITGKRMVKVANKWEERLEGKPCQHIMQQFSRFPNPEKAIRDYVKKLMGRLVFLQFLQKKGWLGVGILDEWGSGDSEFIQNLFAHCDDKDHFIDEVLEPLFNDLNSDNDKKLPQYRTPYLNGGLFEQEVADEMDFPLPEKYMKSLLDFFASYNFTIDENDPDDAEVGVDPEMLGRIFENLLEDNKDKGAFYTPKEIVSYMCRESLIAYLQTGFEDEMTKEAIRQFVTTHQVQEHLPENTDQLLKDVKICDPAIGSGAFPMGLLKELFLCRTALEGISQHQAAEIKKHIIQQNVYGVDIERGAVDIARLRFWLSLIVDEETPQALPNLDFKIMQGNSLLEQYKGVDLSTMTEKKADDTGMLTFFDDMIDVYRKELRDMLVQYFDCTDHIEKQSLRIRIIENVKQQLRDQHIKVDFGDLDLSGNDQFFLWHTWFHDVFSKGGFDIVIGNPPYVLISKELFRKVYEKNFQYQEGKIDLYCLFIEKGIKLCCQKGVMSYITPNTFLSIKNRSKLRHFILNGNSICFIDNYDQSIFDASVNSIVFQLKRNTDADEIIINHHSCQETKTNTIKVNDIKELPFYEININADDSAILIKEKMIHTSTFLEDIPGIEMCLGAQPYHNTIHTEEEMKSKFLHSNYQVNQNYVRDYGGKHFSKYIIDKVPNRWIDYSAEFYTKPDRRFFEGPRIVVREIPSDTLISAYAEEFALFNKSVFNIRCDNTSIKLKYIVAVLNSKAIGYYISAFGDKSKQTLFPRVSMKMLKQLPIPNNDNVNEITMLVDQILTSKHANPSANISALEFEIDRLVYQLYGLTYDEVLVIDPMPPFTREEYES